MENIKEININDDNIKVTFSTKEKDYLYDSLCYRYIRAREHMAQWEWERDCRKQDRDLYFQQAKRDIIKFCELLDEAIGEHN